MTIKQKIQLGFYKRGALQKKISKLSFPNRKSRITSSVLCLAFNMAQVNGNDSMSGWILNGFYMHAWILSYSLVVFKSFHVDVLVSPANQRKRRHDEDKKQRTEGK